jgi:hypothetical protein
VSACRAKHKSAPREDESLDEDLRVCQTGIFFLSVEICKLSFQEDVLQKPTSVLSLVNVGRAFF